MRPVAKKRPKKAPELSADEERFVDEYLIDRNGTAAYIRVHPAAKRPTAAVESHRLLRKPKIAAAVKLGSHQLARQCNTSAVKEVKGLALLANYDIGSAFDMTADDWVPLPPRLIPYETRKAIVGFKVTRRHERDRDGNTTTVENVEYKFADKLAARDKLMRHLGLYKDLPALEVLLAALPPEVVRTVRAALAQAVQQGAVGGGPGGDQPRPALPPGPGGGAAGGGPGDGVAAGGADARPVAGPVPRGPGRPADPAVLPAEREGVEDGHAYPDPDGPLFDG